MAKTNIPEQRRERGLKLADFFFDDKSHNNAKSMSRLLSFLAFFPASAVLLELKTENALFIYLGAFVVNSLGSKTASIFMNRSNKK